MLHRRAALSYFLLHCSCYIAQVSLYFSTWGYITIIKLHIFFTVQLDLFHILDILINPELRRLYNHNSFRG